ncbi:MAG: HD domain-containing protein, partial [Verrucomicrobiota bacterium]
MTDPLRMQDCWAKTDESSLPCLSVRDHCLNVGAVADCAAHLLPSTAARLFPEGGVALVSAHDIGKITPGFLMKCPAWRERWQRILG